MLVISLMILDGWERKRFRHQKRSLPLYPGTGAMARLISFKLYDFDCIN